MNDPRPLIEIMADLDEAAKMAQELTLFTPKITKK